jgi:hypothetical protein
MAHVEYEPIIKTDLVCIRCEDRPHPKGVCTCKEPFYIPEKDWLDVDKYGKRTWYTKYNTKLEETLKQRIKLLEG